MRKIVGVFLSGVVFVGSAKGDWAQRLDRSWIDSPFWDRGKAEILVYHAKEIRYQLPRDGEVVHVFVKEDHDPSQKVKAENWKKEGLISVLKFLSVMTVPTGIYTYRQMLSLFFRRSDFQPFKTVFSNQEWCGQTFKELLLEGGKASLDFNSYWENEGKGQRLITVPPGTIPYNSLPAFLRAIKPSTGGTLSVELFSDLISNQLGTPTSFSAKIYFRGLSSLQINDQKQEAWLVEVKFGNPSQIDRYWFSREPMSPMLRWERNDGAIYELQKRLIDDYWKHNRPGDEKLLK